MFQCDSFDKDPLRIEYQLKNLLDHTISGGDALFEWYYAHHIKQAGEEYWLTWQATHSVGSPYHCLKIVNKNT